MSVINSQREFAAEGSAHRLRILRLLLEVVETNAPFQEVSKPLSKVQDITLCSLFPAAADVPDDIQLFEGDGTPRGFLRALQSALAVGEYDVIHAEGPHVAFLFLLAHGFDGRLMDSTVFTVHNSYQSWKPRNKLLLLPAFGRFRRVVSCGEACFRSFPLLYRTLAGRRYRAVPNGVDVARIDSAIASDVSPTTRDGFTVLCASRLVPIKNHITALDAFELSRMPNDRLVYAGDGPERTHLASEIGWRHLAESVHLRGLMSREEVYVQMSLSDVYLSTSFGEGLPIAVLEAMVARCPVVLSDIPPHREIAAGADFIPLVEPRDTAGFARELEALRGMPLDQRAEVGNRCRAHVESRFALENMLAGYVAIYEELAAERGRM